MVGGRGSPNTLRCPRSSPSFCRRAARGNAGWRGGSVTNSARNLSIERFQMKACPASDAGGEAARVGKCAFGQKSAIRFRFLRNRAEAEKSFENIVAGGRGCSQI